MSKISSGWIQGVNSVRNPWLLPDNQFKWGVNVTVRGGLIQTRPGHKMQLSLPSGNFQGGILFASNKQKDAPVTQNINGVITLTPAKIFDVNGNGVVADELNMVREKRNLVEYPTLTFYEPSMKELTDVISLAIAVLKIVKKLVA